MCKETMQDEEVTIVMGDLNAKVEVEVVEQWLENMDWGKGTREEIDG